MKYFGLIWASLYRKPIRTFLTLASLFIAFLLFGLLQSVAKAFDTSVEIAGLDRLVIAPKYSIIDPLPLGHESRIAQVAGVELIAHQSWFGGTYQDPGNFFPRWPVPPREYMAIHSEYILPPEQLEAFINTRTGAIAGRTIAEEYGWQIGDKLPFIPDIWPNKDGGPWVFDLVGIYDGATDTTETSQFFFSYEYFDEYRQFGQGTVSRFTIRISDPDRSSEIAREIDALFANSINETKTSSEKEYQKQFAKQIGDIGFMMTAILSAVFFTILLLTANTMAQAIRERIPELAILKTIGFNNVNVLFVVLAESLLLAMLGGGLGLAVAALMVPGVGDALPFISGLAVSASVFISGLLIAIGLGFVVGILPALRAMRLNIIDALGERQ